MNNLQKCKVKFDDYDFEWNGEMCPDSFIEENIDYYSAKWEEKNPQLAYKINDGDLDQVYEDIDMEDVKETMEEIYHEVLENNCI